MRNLLCAKTFEKVMRTRARNMHMIPEDRWKKKSSIHPRPNGHTKLTEESQLIKGSSRRE